MDNNAVLTLSAGEVAIITAMFGCLVGAISLLYRQGQASHSKQLADAIEREKNWKQISEEGIKNLEKAAMVAGKPVTYLAPVVPEHSSPATGKQAQTAELQTARARLTAATLNLGLDPRADDKDEKAIKEDVIVVVSQIPHPALASIPAAVPPSPAPTVNPIASEPKTVDVPIPAPLEAPLPIHTPPSELPAPVGGHLPKKEKTDGEDKS